MISPHGDRPYFDAWLRRTGRQFAISGRLTETAMALAAQDGSNVDDWRIRLRTLMEGEDVPSLDLLMRIDKLLAGSSRRTEENQDQGNLS